MGKVLLSLYYILLIHLPSSNIPGGKIFSLLRGYIVSKAIKSAGSNISINKGVVLSQDLELGSNVKINENVRIRKGVIIGSNVEIAPGVTILTSNHKIDRLDIPINAQGVTEVRTVNIEDNTWIGTNAIILPGVTIGKGSVVGAGGVVTKTFSANSIIAGSPAKLIKERGC